MARCSSERAPPVQSPPRRIPRLESPGIHGHPHISTTGGERHMSDGSMMATPAAGAITRAALGQVRPSDQLGDVLALPEHLRDALWRAESAIMQDWDTSAGLVVAGMGGSAIGGALARAALGDHASRPFFVT